MTACFLFSAAGGESPSFNYFRNFADPVSALLCQRKWDLQQRPSTATAAFCSYKVRAENLSNYGFSKILLTFHLLSFSHPRLQQFCTPNLLAHLLKKLSALNNLIPTLPLPFSALLVLTQRGLPGGSKEPEVTLSLVTPSYPGRGLGCSETDSAGSRGHKAQINRDERNI